MNWHYIKKYMPQTGYVLDNGAGPGKYSMELAKEGYKVTLTDLTPRLVGIAKDKAKEPELEGQFEGFYAADVRELYMIKAEQFDASLMLGPMYHLREEDERIQAVRELNRVTKKGGLVFVAFFKPTDELRKLELTELSIDYDDINEFFNELESLEEFKIPLNMQPIKSELYQEEV